MGSVETINLEKDDIGKHVVMLANKSGHVHGSSHVHLIVNKYVATDVFQIKEFLALDPKELRFLARMTRQGITTTIVV